MPFQNASQVDAGARCPWCYTTVHPFADVRSIVHSVQADKAKRIQAPVRWDIHTFYCPGCERPWIVVDESDHPNRNGSARMFYPLAHGRAPTPTDVPEPFAGDYKEACLVLPLSPQASAALARRVLQALIRLKAGIKKATLYAEIEEAQKGLPSFIAENLHLLRQIGNFAAHPQEDIAGVVLPVERDEAELTISVIEQLFDHYFVAPAKAAAIKAKFNQTKMLPSGKTPVQ